MYVPGQSGVRLPQKVHLGRGGAGDRGPQPQRLGVPAAGQTVHLQADQGPHLDDRQVAVVVQPGGAAGQPGGTRSQAAAAAVPYWAVSVLVVTYGSGQVAGSGQGQLAAVLPGPASISRVMTSRTCAAVTSVSSLSGRSRARSCAGPSAHSSASPDRTAHPRAWLSTGTAGRGTPPAPAAPAPPPAHPRRDPPPAPY